MHEPFVQALIALTVATLAYSALCTGWGRMRDSQFLGALAAAFLLLLLVALFLMDATDNPLQDCRDAGQMVLIDGRWACVPPEQGE